jgi:FkbM family methyltransferase
VSYICDNDCKKWGGSINNIEIHSPERLNSEEKSTTIIVISSMYHEQIADQLDRIDIDYIYSTIDGEYSYLPKNSDRVYNMLELYWKYRVEIDKVYSILSDDVSRKVYMNVLKAKIIESSIPYNAYYRSLLGSIYEGGQYFDRKYFKYYDNEVFVDCGAFMGDTILELFNLGIYECKKRNSPLIYAFEPDIINYNILNELLKSNSYDIYVKTILSGVGNSNSTLCPENIINCRHDSIANDVDVPIVKLDDALGEIPVTFIKMDIEGYELEALQGAEILIKKYKPKLAISIYHKPEDFFEIPLLLKKFVPEYKIYVKHHLRSNVSETICYACI